MTDHDTNIDDRDHGTRQDRDNDRLLTITEVADLTRLPIGTLRYKRHDRTGPRSFRLGRRVCYWHSDVLAWIERHYHDDGPHIA